jgi:hypothetical protein
MHQAAGQKRRCRAAEVAQAWGCSNIKIHKGQPRIAWLPRSSSASVTTERDIVSTPSASGFELSHVAGADLGIEFSASLGLARLSSWKECAWTTDLATRALLVVSECV